MTAIDEAKQLVMARYSPANRKGEQAGWDGHLSVSALSSMSAYDYAMAISKWEQNHVDPYYSFKGNALGDRALEGILCREIEVRVPISDGHMLTGTMDAIHVSPGEYVVLEHKAYGNPDTLGLMKAERQGKTYLAMVHHMHKTLGSDLVLPPAQWMVGPAATIKPGDKPVGVLVCVAPNNPPGMVLDYPMNEADCEAHMKRMLSKCRVIIDAVETGDMDRAKMWDRSEGMLDFLTLDNKPVTELPGDIPLQIAKVAELQDIERRAVKDTRENRDILLAMLDAQGISSAVSGDFKASVTTVESTVIKEHTRRGYRTVKVT